MKFPSLVLLVLIGHFSFGQKCVVVDKDSEIPVPNVQVTDENGTRFAVSDNNGIVDLSAFEEMELLTFTHVSYVELELIKKHVRRDFTTVYLQFKSELLEEVFVSATKGVEERRRIAEEVAVFSDKDIQNAVPQTSADMLSRIPGVKVQKSQFGGGSPVLRGMEANRILLVVDGVRMNNAIYRKGHLQNSITVAPTQLEKTEVLFGPSSVVYGSDALGGVIHYYTRKPRLSERPMVNTDLLLRYGTANHENTINGSVELQMKKIATFTSITYSRFGDLRMGDRRAHEFEGWGLQYEYSDNTDSYYNPDPVVNPNPNKQRNVGYGQTDILQKILVPLDEQNELLFNFQYSTSSNINRFDKLTEQRDGQLRFAEWYYGPQDRLLLSGQYLLRSNRRWLSTGAITAAYQNIKESRIERKFDSFDRDNQWERVDIFSLNGDFKADLDPKKGRTVGYGFELAYNDVESRARGDILDVVGNEIVGVKGSYKAQTRYADGGSDYMSSAIYANYRQDLGKKSTLNTGARLTNTVLNAKWVDTTFFQLPESDISLMNTAITATVSYTYRPNPNWQLNGVLSSGFRSPNIDDTGKVREKRGEVTVPNADLRPEYAYNAEIGALKYFSEKRYHLGFASYYTLLHDYIVRQPYEINGSSTIIYNGEEGDVVANVNKGNAFVVGATLTFRGQFSNTWNSRASITYAQGRAYDTDEPLSSIPPLFGNVEFNYIRNRLETGIHVIFNAQKERDDYNLSEGIDNIEQTPYLPKEQEYYGSPAWYTLNYYMRIKTSKRIDVLFNLDNILDHHYKEFASGISAPGRNVSITLIGSF